MFRLLGLGLMAALFFSSTFVLNRAMSLEGGHWVWAALLRYAFMFVLICAGMLLAGRARLLAQVVRVYLRRWLFWTLAGTVAFGIFYTGVTLAASFAPGWVVATTWQLTILATPLVLAAYGRKVPVRGLLFSLLIFGGIVLVNIENVLNPDFRTGASWQALLLGALPVLIAAIAYPAGLQLVWEARSGSSARVRTLDMDAIAVVDNPFARVLLLVLGSIPWWIGLLVITQPPPPTQGQWVNSALVALFSGIVATVLFLQARHLARSAYELAAVDSTQSAEVIFSLLGEVLILGGVLPGVRGWLGIGLTVVGLVLYLLSQGRLTRNSAAVAAVDAIAGP